MKKNIRKGSLVAKTAKLMLTMISTIGALGTIGAITNEKYHWLSTSTEGNTPKDTLNSSVQSENGIKITGMKKGAADSSETYGSQTISFSYDEDTTDKIMAKLVYSEDQSDVESEIFSMTLYDTSIELVCNKAFTKQITLILYSRNNDSVNAKVTLDFLERLTVDMDYPLFHGRHPQYVSLASITVTTTGGTMTVDKEIRDRAFTIDFKELNEYVKPIFSYYAPAVLSDYAGVGRGAPLSVQQSIWRDVGEKGWVTGANISTASLEDDATGMAGMDLFSPTDFLKKIQFVYHSDTNLHGNIGVTALDLMQAHSEAYEKLLDAFTTKNIFKYSCKVNNVEYVAYSRIESKDVLIKNISSISSTTTSLTF